MPAIREFNIMRWLGEIRILRIDRVFYVALLFSALLFSGFPNRIFTISHNYYAEIPAMIFIFTLPFCGVSLKNSLITEATIKVLLALAVLVPFLIIGMVRGAEFTDVYADFRAQMIFVIATVVLFSIDDLDAVRFIVISGTICIFSFVLIYALQLERSFIPVESVDSGKVTFPWPIFVALALWAAYRRTIFVFAILASFIFLAVHTSYRYAYLVTGMTAFACVIGPFLRSKSINSVTKGLAMSTIGVAAATAAQVSRYELVPILNGLAVYARNMGLPEVFVFQLFQKPIAAMTTGINDGDMTYLQFAQHLFDVPRFALPQGLGHKSSYGDPLIFGGNTVDNGVIFVDYHFSIWALLGLIVFVAFMYWQRTRFASWQQHLENLVLAIPLIFLLYIRAFWFIDVLGALSMAAALRMYSILGSPVGAFVSSQRPAKVKPSSISGAILARAKLLGGRAAQLKP